MQPYLGLCGVAELPLCNHFCHTVIYIDFFKDFPVYHVIAIIGDNATAPELRVSDVAINIFKDRMATRSDF